MKSRYLLLLMLAGVCTPAGAQEFSLGTAQNFAVLAGSTVTNTGPSVINGGDVGVDPGTSITGFPPGVVVPPSTTLGPSGVTLQAQNDLTTSYNVLAGLAPTQDLSGQDLGGLTLLPGVYKFDSAAQLTGTLTLDALGSSSSLFVFQIGSALTTASNSFVSEINDGVTNGGCNIFWQIGSSATLGTDTAFEGNILANQSITLDTGATIIDGRVLAENAAVTLDTNTISIADCPFVPGGAGTFYTPQQTTPEPGPYAFLISLGLTGVALLRRRRTCKCVARQFVR